jgi:hypothetical protein
MLWEQGGIAAHSRVHFNNPPDRVKHGLDGDLSESMRASELCDWAGRPLLRMLGATE